MKQCETLEKMLKMSAQDRDRAGRVVARSFYAILRRNGFGPGEIMAVAGHILDGVIRDMKAHGEEGAGNGPAGLIQRRAGSSVA